MGWGTDFKADIFLNREIYKSEYELDDQIEEIESDIVNTRAKILMYSSTNIKDIIPEDWKDEPINFIYNSVNEELNNLSEQIRHLQRLFLYKESKPDFTKKND
jgi:hypothetical protein